MRGFGSAVRGGGAGSTRGGGGGGSTTSMASGAWGGFDLERSTAASAAAIAACSVIATRTPRSGGDFLSDATWGEPPQLAGGIDVDGELAHASAFYEIDDVHDAAV